MLLTHLCVGEGINLVHRVARRPARLPVKVVALNEHRVVGLAPDPHVALTQEVQLQQGQSSLPQFRILNLGGKFKVKTLHHWSREAQTLSSLDAFAYVEPRPLACLGAVNVADGWEMRSSIKLSRYLTAFEHSTN